MTAVSMPLTVRQGMRNGPFKRKGGIISPPTIQEGIVYVGSQDGHFYALEVATGRQLWERVAGTGGGAGGSPRAVITLTSVYLMTPYSGLVVVDSKTGQERWRSRGIPVASTIVSNGMVYLLGARGGLYAVDPECQNTVDPEDQPSGRPRNKLSQAL